MSPVAGANSPESGVLAAVRATSASACRNGGEPNTELQLKSRLQVVSE